MTNMKTLIRIVFIIFIAKGFDSLGGVCDDCCECLKEDEKKEDDKKEEIKENEKKEDENITAESLVNGVWFNNKTGLVLKIFKKKENDNIFTSTENGDKISIKLAENDNSKIAYQDENEDKLKLEGKKYAFFEIKTQEGENTVYLYCSDMESSVYNNGIFEGTDHISICNCV